LRGGGPPDGPVDVRRDRFRGEHPHQRGRGAAQRGAVFQAVDLAEPSKPEVLAGRGARMARVFWRQNKQSFKSTVNLSDGTCTQPRLIPRSEGQLGVTITEVIDFSFAFRDPAFLAALARRGITTQAQLQKVFVTPLTPTRPSSRRSRI
jgi:Cu2+-containing amine oxidase